jgi:lysophospholipase L1-like esterase
MGDMPKDTCYRRWITLLAIGNMISIGLLIGISSHYQVGKKAWQRLFHEGRIPLVTPDHRNNRNYEGTREIFRLYPSDPIDGIVLGDSQVAGASWPELLWPSRVVGRGIDGDTAEGLFERVTDLANSDPRWIAVMIGTNDILGKRDASDISGSIVRCAERLRAQHPDAPLLLISIPPMADWVENAKERNRAILEINERLRLHCSQDDDFRWIPLHDQVVDGSGYLARSMTMDGVHLGAGAYALLRELLREATRELSSTRQRAPR